MQLADVLTADRIRLDVTASSKKTLLEKVAALLAKDANSAAERDIFESLCQRERLGSTGLGFGVAIPHGRNQGQQDIVGALIRLKKPIDFDAPDQQKVDLFFALAIPEECSDAHLKLLANLAEFFKDPDQLDSVRVAESPETLLTLMQYGE
ncbi:MAG TPA: PTS sugar transporter subunit IIA [Wenzhouxiangella sp.]